MASWKRDFGSGLIILVPLLVTIIVLAWIYGYLTRVPVPIDYVALFGTEITEPVRVLLSLLIFILLVFSVGYLMRTAVGTLLERTLDNLMNQLPGLRIVYNASKVAVETTLTGAGEFQTPVKLEVWDGLRMTAFKTGNRAPDGREILFVPTSPNITSGYVVEVEEDRYTELDESMEDALTRVLSAGFGEKNGSQMPSFGGSRQSGDMDIEAVEEVAADIVGGSSDESDGESSESAESITQKSADDAAPDPADESDTE